MSVELFMKWVLHIYGVYIKFAVNKYRLYEQTTGSTCPHSKNTAQ